MGKRFFFSIATSALLSLSVAMTGVASSSIGDGCTSHADCGSKGFCIPPRSETGATGFVGGYCIEFDCSSENLCAANAQCFRIDADESTACLSSCVRHADCREGYQCKDGACLPGCSESPCPGKMKCNSEKICVDG